MGESVDVWVVVVVEVVIDGEIVVVVIPTVKGFNVVGFKREISILGAGSVVKLGNGGRGISGITTSGMQGLQEVPDVVSVLVGGGVVEDVVVLLEVLVEVPVVLEVVVSSPAIH